jgi:peptidoglycan/LPS O-acetylase OafA/YrhL
MGRAHGEMTSQSNHRYVMLDGVRGMAAIIVLMFHLNFSPFGDFRRGYLMVDLFFMLSGFVMALAYEPKMRSGLGVARFMLGRFRRLGPVIALGVAIGIASYVWLNDPSWGIRGWARQIAMALVLFPNVWVSSDPALFPLNRAHWSLFFELVANLFHVVVLWRLRDSLVLVVGVLFAGLLVWSILLLGDNTRGAFQNQWYFGFLRVGFAYVAGVWLARMWRKGPSVPRVPWQVVLLSPVAALLAIEFLPLWLGEIVAVIGFFPVILWLAAAADVAGPSRKALVWLGAISYPLYATHGPILALLRDAGDGTWVKLAACAISLAVAVAAALVIERRRLQASLAAVPLVKADRPAD